METENNLNTRSHRIKDKLSCLQPTHLEVIDESISHANHFNNNSAETHLKLIVKADSLNGIGLLKQHKMIKQLLADEFDKGLHALTIKIIN